MSALYDGRIEHKHELDGRVYQLVLKHRANGKDYTATRTWHHSRVRDYGTLPALHHRDSMKWSAAQDIDAKVASDLKASQ